MDAIGNERQFLDHLAPVWRLLPEEHRGRFLVEPTLVEHARKLGIDAIGQPRPPHTVSQPRPNPGWHPALVAGYGDVKEGRRLGYGPFVFLEHGIAQTYDVRPGKGHASYSGGLDRDDNDLVLVPNEHAASRWRANYPAARVEIVGCPKLDYLPKREPGPGPVICTAFHWPAPLSISGYAGTALGDYLEQLPKLAAAFRVIGTAHPKGDWPERMKRQYARAGIPFVADFEDVCRQADVLVFDNCVVPETPVLCADLRWRPAGDLRVGDEIIACDEDARVIRQVRKRNDELVGREDRLLRTAVITANARKVLPSITVTTEHGALTVSDTHPWMVRRPISYPYVWPAKPHRNITHSYKHWEWVEARELKVGDEVAFLGSPWSDAVDRDAGWLAGMFDGEGNLYSGTDKKTNGRRLALSVAQNEGRVLDELRRLISDGGWKITGDQRAFGVGTRTRKLTVGGGLMEMLRFLGSIRPMRLLHKAMTDQVWAGARVSSIARRSRVLSIEAVGDREVATISTSSRTFIAGGFIAHNTSAGYEFAATGRPVVVLNARYWSRKQSMGLRFWDAAGVGVNVNPGDDLGAAVREALADAPSRQEDREEALQIVYGRRSGGAEAAVRAIVSWLEERQEIAA